MYVICRDIDDADNVASQNDAAYYRGYVSTKSPS